MTIFVSPSPQPPNNQTQSNDIQKLIDAIDKMRLSGGVTKSLEDPLNMAIKQLNENNDESACRSLDAFLNQVETNESNGQLTSQQATEIQQDLGCPSLSSPPFYPSESKGPSSSESYDAGEGWKNLQTIHLIPTLIQQRRKLATKRIQASQRIRN